MRILFLGDIYGEKAIDVLANELPKIKNDYKINIVLANAENAYRGRGLSKENYDKLMKMQISMLTLGNHAFSNSKIKDFINDANIVRPANFTTNYGVGYKELRYNDKKLIIVNMLGRIFNDMALDCPFKTMDNILKNTRADYYIVDFHGEATSEKLAFAFNYSDKISAVIGTHTHVQTADERLINNMLYISDVGMCGPRDGIIGSSREQIIERFKTGIYTPASVMDGITQINAVVLDLNNIKNKIERIHFEF